MWPPQSFWHALASCVIFGAVGIILTLLGFKAFDWITPKLDLEKELMDRNVAVAIVVAAVILGIAYVIAQAVAS
jgi:uncharacterized membrane protein YjfL (UPF0719 family)